MNLPLNKETIPLIPSKKGLFPANDTSENSNLINFNKIHCKK